MTAQAMPTIWSVQSWGWGGSGGQVLRRCVDRRRLAKDHVLTCSGTVLWVLHREQLRVTDCMGRHQILQEVVH